MDHVGTHVDAFVHTKRGGATIDEMPLDLLWGRRFALTPGTSTIFAGGKQQMVAIARALVARPRPLLMDEPSLGLAPKIVETIFEAFSLFRQQGVTILLVEQRALMSLKICDRACVLEAGRLVLSGSHEEMISNPRVAKAYLGRNQVVAT
jgi:branched-chain amino acid transport system ATP-binding protein